MKIISQIFSYAGSCIVSFAIISILLAGITLGSGNGYAATVLQKSSKTTGATPSKVKPATATKPAKPPKKQAVASPRQPVPASKKLAAGAPASPASKPMPVEPKPVSKPKPVQPKPVNKLTPPPRAGQVAGFSGNVFGEKTHKPEVDKGIARRLAKAQALTPRPQLKLGNEKLSITGSEPPPQISDSPVKPVNTSLPGRPDTVAKFEDKDDASGFNVGYKLDDKAAARLAVNQDDKNASTYVPTRRKGETLNSAGVYLDVDVEDDLQFQVGGEVRSTERGAATTEDQSAAGASVGMKWSF